jgi:hypothetical protein
MPIPGEAIQIPSRRHVRPNFNKEQISKRPHDLQRPLVQLGAGHYCAHILPIHAQVEATPDAIRLNRNSAGAGGRGRRATVHYALFALHSLVFLLLGRGQIRKKCITGKKAKSNRGLDARGAAYLTQVPI